MLFVAVVKMVVLDAIPVWKDALIDLIHLYGLITFFAVGWTVPVIAEDAIWSSEEVSSPRSEGKNLE